MSDLGQIKAVQVLRRRFESMIPKTWDDYFDAQKNPNGWLSAYEIGLMLHDGLQVSFARAAEIMQQVFPEAFADYWEALRNEAA